MTSAKYLPPNGETLPRKLYLAILRSAVEVGEHRFAREAALTWLAAFPGDLEAGLLYARALLGEAHPKQSLPILEGLCQVDPEYLEAQQLQLEVRRAIGLPTVPDTLTGLIALNGAPEGQETIAAWGRHLGLARLALKQRDFDRADQFIRLTLAAEPPTPLAAVTHLEIIEASGQFPLAAKRSLAELYRQRWPDCLQCTLMLADWLMDGGESDQAVALLHEAAARDVGGQVALRLWGEDHPYRAVWPDRPEVALKTSIPAAVASALGWNQLPEGVKGSLVQASQCEPKPEGLSPSTPPTLCEAKNVEPSAPAFSPGSAAEPSSAPGEEPRPAPVYAQMPETLLPIQEELERLAGALNQRSIMRADGRFPIYVVFSVQLGLETQYGLEGAVQVEKAMHELVQAVQARPGWGARLFLADQPASTAPLDIRPARPSDPWDLKLALTDLDAALARHGEMIGAVLIVGGPEVVPFHHLPNPVDDNDLEVPSDNPYATRDENYFISEWPIGRLPGGRGNDPKLLLDALHRISARHRADTRRKPWFSRGWERLWSWLRPRWSRLSHPSFGYTAAIWRQASLSVFRPIGEPRALLVSPPLGINGNSAHAANPIPVARLGYFNLHGLADAAEWYGQRDPLEALDGPDYPVALRPEDIGQSERRNNACAPQVIFSEACYGAHILDKSVEEALALKFLAAGSQAVAGSTCMAYGSVTTPLIAADLLGHAFWNFLREGIPAGEALRRAKISLARDMHDRQGYLDGEDQKTLISFVLYGDPLAQPANPPRKSKSVLRPLKIPFQVKTVCDRASQPSENQDVPPEVLRYVKHVVEQYLPGMANAQCTVTQEHTQCCANGHTCPTGQLGSKAVPSQEPGRRLVTLSKQVERSNHVHSQYARLTLDNQGKLVKLAVSR